MNKKVIESLNTNNSSNKQQTQIKTNKRNNAIRTSLLKITYNETKQYLETCTIKLNDQEPSKIAKNFSVEIRLNNPVFTGNLRKIKEQSKQSLKTRAGSQNITFGRSSGEKIQLFESNEQNIFNVDNSGEKVRDLLMSRKKNIAHKKLENSKKSMNYVKEGDEVEVLPKRVSNKEIDELCNLYDVDYKTGDFFR